MLRTIDILYHMAKCTNPVAFYRAVPLVKCDKDGGDLPYKSPVRQVDLNFLPSLGLIRSINKDKVSPSNVQPR